MRVIREADGPSQPTPGSLGADGAAGTGAAGDRFLQPQRTSTRLRTPTPLRAHRMADVLAETPHPRRASGGPSLAPQALLAKERLSLRCFHGERRVPWSARVSHARGGNSICTPSAARLRACRGTAATAAVPHGYVIPVAVSCRVQIRSASLHHHERGSG